MAKTKLQKQEIIRNLVEKLNKSKSAIFVNFKGLGVKDNEELRNKLREENSEYYVAKKTLIDLAVKESGVKDANSRDFDGQVAAIFGYEDEVAPAKIVDEFNKSRENKLNFAGGILEGNFISNDKVSELAKLPSKQELYAKVVGSLNAPISGFVNALSGNLRNLVYVLKAIESKK
ncbi:MAG: 50S ribosomal protein L10 [Candidatus Falkowbacteria bacterium]